MSSSDPAIAVFGATGEIGRRVCAELARMGAAITIVGRHADALDALARSLPIDPTGEIRPPSGGPAGKAVGVPAPRARPIAGRHCAGTDDAEALARAFAGARVVINAAGPLRDTAAPVLAAALAAGAHYVDVGGEQAVLQAIYERHESEVRRAGLIALPGAGLDGAIGDLAAAWAVQHLLGAADPGAAVRTAPAPRLADDQPIDDIAVSHVIDRLALSAGSQRALFGTIGARTLVWRRDRWEPGPAGDHRRVNAGAAHGGERDALGFAGGAVLTIPRHIAAQLVTTYVSTTRSAGAATALRLLSRALAFVPRRAGELLVPYAAPDADYGATRFAVVTQVRRGFAAAQIVVGGHDLYRTTAVIAAWSACRIAERGAGPLGMRAPGELFRAEPALRAIARAAELTIEPSFG